jgi:putative ABC transport system permease protein
LMIAGLRTWWVGAITVSFLEYHAQPLSLVMGWLLGWLAALGTIILSTRQLKLVPIAKLLKGQMEIGVAVQAKKTRFAWLPSVCALIAVAVLALGQFLQGQAQAGAFVGAGMLFLISGLGFMLIRLKSSPRCGGTGWGDPSQGGAMLSPSSLASSNAKRAPSRSILAIGLVAIASFLILSMSLFQSAPNEAGTGGFVFVGKSTHAIHQDLANPEHQRDVLGDRKSALADLSFVPIRVRGGDDASCNNLYQANEPQIFGISQRMDAIDRNAKGRSAFAWFAVGDHKSHETPWKLLETQANGEAESPVPVVLDQNTALWALHLGGYVGEKFSYTFDDRKIYFRTVGVLQNTILQGSLVIGESNFERLFPSVTGYRSFLIKSKDAASLSSAKLSAMETARSVLEDGWSDSGLSLAPSDSILKQLLAVQNTYLGAFQVLGALGLLLGTIGLGVAQLRSAMERRGELAAMRAIGFSKSRLMWLLTLENGWQLIRGVGIGVGAAALATLPAIFHGQPFAGLAWPMSMLAIVIVSGMSCSIAAAWGAMRWPLLSALRSDK